MNLRLFDTITMGLLALIMVCVAEMNKLSIIGKQVLCVPRTHFFDLAIVDLGCLLTSVSDETLIGTANGD
jgi:hypothetical protein